jgi:competence protein ComGF
MIGMYIHSPIRVQVVMLNLLITALPLSTVYITYSAFIRYSRKNGKTVVQYIDHSENLTCVTQNRNIIYHHTVTESGICFN